MAGKKKPKNKSMYESKEVIEVLKDVEGVPLKDQGYWHDPNLKVAEIARSNYLNTVRAKQMIQNYTPGLQTIPTPIGTGFHMGNNTLGQVRVRETTAPSGLVRAIPTETVYPGNAPATFPTVLHETLHTAGRHHVTDPNSVMSTYQKGNKVADAIKFGLLHGVPEDDVYANSITNTMVPDYHGNRIKDPLKRGSDETDEEYIDRIRNYWKDLGIDREGKTKSKGKDK